jgi:hypothetical protein
MRFRFLIADIMVLVVPAAAISYALSYDTSLLDHVVYALYLAGLAATTLGAKFGRRRAVRKMFCKGAMLFGWFYLPFGLQLGFNAGQERLVLAIVGLGAAFLAGYATVRLTPRDHLRPRPQVPAADETQSA